MGQDADGKKQDVMSMTETDKHKKLKLLGRVLLKDRGYLDEEIFEEYKVKIGVKKSYIVDVCGISGKQSIAVECGKTNPEKLINLKLVFDEIIHLPYGITSLDADLRETLEKYIIKIKSLEKEITKLRKEIKKKDMKIKSLWEREKHYEKIKLVVELLKRQANRYYYPYSTDDKKIEAMLNILDDREPQDEVRTDRNPGG